MQVSLFKWMYVPPPPPPLNMIKKKNVLCMKRTKSSAELVLPDKPSS